MKQSILKPALIGVGLLAVLGVGIAVGNFVGGSTESETRTAPASVALVAGEVGPSLASNSAQALAPPSPTPVPPQALSTPVPTSTPPLELVPALRVESSAANGTRTGFSPQELTLSNLGDRETITVATSNIDPDSNGVQINVQHPGTLEVASPACAGIFENGTLLPRSQVAGGTLLGCLLMLDDVSSGSGVVMTFDLVRVGDYNQDQEVIFGLEGAAKTQFSNRGTSVDVGDTNRVVVSP